MPRIPAHRQRVLAIVVVVLLVVLPIGWLRFKPRFRIPQELQQTIAETSFRTKLSELTANQDWFQTDAGIKKLCDVPMVARNDFKQLAAQLLPDLEFYWVRLTTYHLIKPSAVSAPYTDLVIAVDRRSGEVWSFNIRLQSHWC